MLTATIRLLPTARRMCPSLVRPWKLPTLSLERDDSPAGDVITSVGRSSVGSPTELQSLLSRYHPGDSVSVTWSVPSGGQNTATIQLANGPVG